MVDFNRFSGFNMENIHDFRRWTEDNKEKSKEGCEVMEAVMSIGPDIASAAALKWLRKAGKDADEVKELADRIVADILLACSQGQEDVIRDSASMFAGTGQSGLVMMMTFVSYSLIGVEVANNLLAE